MGRRQRMTFAAGFPPPPSKLDLFGTGDVDGPSLLRDDRKNRCYELSAYALALGSAPADATLFHGSIDGGPDTAGRIGHAWLRLPGGRIWEPISYRVYEPEWIQWAQARPEVGYSCADTRRMIAVSGHYGPWHDPSAHRVVSDAEREWQERLAEINGG